MPLDENPHPTKSVSIQEDFVLDPRNNKEVTRRIENTYENDILVQRRTDVLHMGLLETFDPVSRKKRSETSYRKGEKIHTTTFTAEEGLAFVIPYRDGKYVLPDITYKSEDGVLLLLTELENQNSSSSQILGDLRNKTIQSLKQRLNHIRIARANRATMNDPSLVNFDAVKSAWIRDPDIRIKLHIPTTTPQNLVDAHIKSMIARNLFHQKKWGEKEINQHSVETELTRIISTREKHADISFLRDRKVLCIVHNDSRHNFLPQELRDAIKNQKPNGNPKYLCIGKNGITEENIEEKAHDAFRSMSPPFTFLFLGHGIQGKIYLSEKKIITTEKLAEWLIERREIFKDEYKTLNKKDRKDILYFGCCFGANIGDSINQRARTPKIIISSNEYDQIGVTEHESDVRCRLLEALFKKSPVDIKIGTFMDIEFDVDVNKHANPTVFTEDEKDDLPRTQITKNTDSLSNTESSPA